MKREIVFASSGPCARGAQEGRTWGVTAFNKEGGVDERRQEQRPGSRKALDGSAGHYMACLIRMVSRGSALGLWGPEEYFSKGSEESLKTGCRDTLKSVFREIPRANSSAASQGGRWRDLRLQS